MCQLLIKTKIPKLNFTSQLQSCSKGFAEPELSVIYSSAYRPSYKGWATQGLRQVPAASSGDLTCP